ncbi:DMT family transporter [Viscerimonas tarda]
MKFSSKQQGHLIMFFVVTIFAINIPISKALLSGHISSSGLTLARMLFASVAFWMTSLFVKKEQIQLKDHLIIFVSGILGIAVNQGLFVYGLGKTSPVDASIIITSGPLFAMIIAAIVLKEPITSKKVIGVITGALGAILLVYTSHQGNSTQNSSTTGNLAILSSAFCYAFYLVLSKPLASKYSSITLMKWMFLYSTIFLFPFTYNDILDAELFRQADITPYLMIFFTLFGATFITYMLIPHAQQRIRATTISMYNNLQPLIASFIAILAGMDKISMGKIVAGVLIFLGVYFVTKSKSKADLDAEKEKSLSTPTTGQ